MSFREWGYTVAPAVFGTNYGGASSRARSTTTSATFQTKVSITTPVLSGNFLVRWQALVDQSSTASQVEARLWNVTDGFSMGQWQLLQPSATINRMLMGGSVGFTLANSSKTFEIQWRALGGNTAGIEDAFVDFWRIS